MMVFKGVGEFVEGIIVSLTYILDTFPKIKKTTLVFCIFVIA